MVCLTDIKIQEYVEGTLNNVESAMARDHIIVCDRCKGVHDRYEKLEKFLLHPVEVVPPSIIERNVLNFLFPRLPSYSSIFALIAASFILLVTSIYIYFDFANNSLIRAFNLTSSNTSSWIGSIVRFISTAFSFVYASFKALNRLLSIIFNLNPGLALIGVSVILFCFLLFFFMLRAAYRKLRIKV